MRTDSFSTGSHTRTHRVHTTALRRVALLGGALIVLFVMTGLVYLDFQREKSHFRRVADTAQMLAEIQHLALLLERAGAEHRGYLLTGDARYREAFESAIRQSDSSRDSLHRLIAEASGLNETDRLIGAAVSGLRQTMRVLDAQGMEAALRVMRGGEDARRIEACRFALRTLEESQRRSLATGSTEGEAVRTHTLLGLGSAALVFLLVLAGILIERDIQQRERDRHQARGSEERLRLAQQIARIGTFEWNAKTGVNTWTPELESMYGLSAGSFARTQPAWESLIHPDDRAQAVERVREAFATGLAGGAEWRVTWPDGTVRWLAGRWQVFRDPGGAPLRLMGVNIDITERKMAEEAVLESRARLEAALASMTEAVFISDDQGRFVEFNDAFATFHRFTSKEQCATTFAEYPAILDVSFPDGATAPIEMWAVPRALRGETATDAEYLLRRKDTGESWVGSYSFGPIRDRAGRIAGAVVVGRDVTARKREVERLRVSEQRFRSIFENAPMGIAIATWDGRLQQGNPAFCDLLGYTEEELRGLWFASLIPPEDSAANLTEYKRILRGEVTSFQNESRYTRKSGDPVWVHKFVSVLPTESGESPRFMALATDITERKRAEEEVRLLNLRLERRVAERTAQLEDANGELEAFAYSVSHDLRAPLRGIDGWSLALVEDYASQLDTRALGYLQRVRSETQRMGQLIDDLLQLSRITRFAMNRTHLDLTAIAETVISRLRDANPARPVEFVVSPGLAAFGDASLLDVALTNLLGNAVKFTRPHAEARIEFGRTGNPGEPAFFIRDNGVGFDMAFAGALFGAFQRLHKPSEFPGTGIGLATVQRIVHRHGGRVWAEAQPGHGATFYFTIGGP